jgi:hypothetical protein
MSGKNVEELMELNDSLLANIKLLTEHIEFAETIISTAAAALDASGAPTNGADGYGKRQELSMAQRINWLVNKIVHLEKKLAVAVRPATRDDLRSEAKEALAAIKQPRSAGQKEE